jgi:hypothetical protein
MRELHEAIRLQPDFLDAHQSLGDELRQAGDLEGAFTEWGQPARLHPADAEAHC